MLNATPQYRQQDFVVELVQGLEDLYIFRERISDYLRDREYGPPPPEDWRQPLYSKLALLKIFGSKRAIPLAELAVQSMNILEGPGRDIRDERWTASEDAIANFRDQVRRDLGS